MDWRQGRGIIWRCERTGYWVLGTGYWVLRTGERGSARPFAFAEVDLEVHAEGVGDLLEGVESWVRAFGLEEVDRLARDSQSLAELGLGEAEVLALPAEGEADRERGGDRHLDGLAAGPPTWTRGRLAEVEVRLEPSVEGFGGFGDDVLARSGEGLAAGTVREVRKEVSALPGHRSEIVHVVLLERELGLAFDVFQGAHRDVPSGVRDGDNPRLGGMSELMMRAPHAMEVPSIVEQLPDQAARMHG